LNEKIRPSGKKKCNKGTKRDKDQFERGPFKNGKAERERALGARKGDSVTKVHPVSTEEEGYGYD